jgi:hypothetical protein
MNGLHIWRWLLNVIIDFQERQMKKVTRRQVLGPIGVAAGSCVLSSCFSRNMISSPGKDGKAGFPWPYAELDPDITAERTYYDCEKGHCMYGVFAPVVEQLAEKRGEPYRSFPVAMMRYGVGGVGGSGSLCGALNGAAALIGLFAKSEKETKQLIGGLFLWYEQAELPAYVPEKPILDIEVPMSVSNSVLCHVSVTRWCETSGYKTFSNPQMERCKRLTADTAKKTVEVLNTYFAGKPLFFSGLSEAVKRCKSCHTKGSDISDSKGNMNCGSCHFSLASEHP